jgi:leucyl-tRNA synthetase
MAKFPFPEKDKHWQQFWKQNATFRHQNPNESSKAKFFVMDMFPYPSGSGLHVGHPLGYIATDIVAKYHKLLGFNVLHPMGFDSFGLPAENYAIQTGTHPAITTEKNIARYKEQLEMLGLGYSDTAELRTSDSEYYRWTQWIFLKLFDSWYDRKLNKARPISDLTAHLNQYGTQHLDAAGSEILSFTAEGWKALSEAEQQKALLNYRLAYISYAPVNWCEALGTVLANEEVKDGLSERGGHPVTRIPMRQWSLRITAYADRLLEGLDHIEWSDALKEMQRNWIGRSSGLEIAFALEGREDQLEIFTTRPDTIFGVSFLSVAPEHPLAPSLLTEEQKAQGLAYIEKSKSRSERERMADTKQVSGVFSGSYALHPFSGRKVPVWIADYVLAGYGTGAVMAVPAHDDRDFLFASHFSLEIQQVIQCPEEFDLNSAAWTEKSGKAMNSDFLNGLQVPAAIEKAITEAETRGLGKRKINYRFRDAIFSRQRYWGEPIPIIFKDDVPYALPESELPLRLPEVESYKPTGTGESPLAAIESWVNLPDGSRRETNTMPGWAGSSWYFLRYLDAHNSGSFSDAEKAKYWMNVDLYIGGTEHAVGHLLYSRFWTKVLYDLGHSPVEEPFQKLVNQGMILGYRYYLEADADNKIIYGLKNVPTGKATVKLEIPQALMAEHASFKKERLSELLEHHQLNPNGWKWEAPEGDFVETPAYTDKMSKSIGNVVNPDDMCQQYGADTFRMYEMFLGPLEQYKPWNTNGITGVHGFLKKVWNLLHNENDQLNLTQEAPTKEELRLLHSLIRKVKEDIERLSFNTSVPAFMVFANEMHRLACRKQEIWTSAIICLAPFAPHIAEEIWKEMGNSDSIFAASFPEFKAEHLVLDEITYPVQINGKTSNFTLTYPAGLDKNALEEAVRSDEKLGEILKGRELKKLIVVPGRIVNLVVG